MELILYEHFGQSVHEAFLSFSLTSCRWEWGVLSELVCSRARLMRLICNKAIDLPTEIACELKVLTKTCLLESNRKQVAY